MVDLCDDRRRSMGSGIRTNQTSWTLAVFSRVEGSESANSTAIGLGWLDVKVIERKHRSTVDWSILQVHVCNSKAPFRYNVPKSNLFTSFTSINTPCIYIPPAFGRCLYANPFKSVESKILVIRLENIGL